MLTERIIIGASMRQGKITQIGVAFTDHARIVGYTEVGRVSTGKSASVSATRADRAYQRVGRFATK
jgi:hypothetical protein